MDGAMHYIAEIYNCVRRYSKTVFEYSRTRREPVYLKTVRPFSNSDAHNLHNIRWNYLMKYKIIFLILITQHKMNCIWCNPPCLDYTT